MTDLSSIGDRLLRVLGGLLALLGGFGTGALAVLLVPVRVADLGFGGSGGFAAARVPVAVVVAIGGALFLVWFAGRATGLRWAVLLPAAGWFAVAVLAMRTTAGGDRLLMPDDVVAALSLFGGTVVMVVGLVRTVAQPRPPAPIEAPPGDRSLPGASTSRTGALGD